VTSFDDDDEGVGVASEPMDWVVRGPTRRTRFQRSPVAASCLKPLRKIAERILRRGRADFSAGERTSVAANRTPVLATGKG